MRRIAPFCICALLSGCIPQRNFNKPLGYTLSETMSHRGKIGNESLEVYLRNVVESGIFTPKTVSDLRKVRLEIDNQHPNLHAGFIPQLDKIIVEQPERFPDRYAMESYMVHEIMHREINFFCTDAEMDVLQKAAKTIYLCLKDTLVIDDQTSDYVRRNQERLSQSVKTLDSGHYAPMDDRKRFGEEFYCVLMQLTYTGVARGRRFTALSVMPPQTRGILMRFLSP